MTKRSIATPFPPLLLLIIFCLITCSDPKINGLEDERGIYSIYGALDIDKNPNYIRVKDLRIPLSADSSEIDGVVEFQDLETGTTTILQDTIVEFNENRTNNYILHEDLEPRQSYQLTVTRPDGNFVSSIATTPGITRHSVQPNENVSCFSNIEIRFQNVLPTEQIRLYAGFSYEGFQTQEISRYCEFEREGNELVLNITTRNLLGIVLPAPGTNQILCRKTESAIGCGDLESNTVNLRYLHLGPEWQKVFPIYPVDPEDIRDVENGLGFFGGYREDNFSYSVIVPEFN